MDLIWLLLLCLTRTMLFIMQLFYQRLYLTFTFIPFFVLFISCCTGHHGSKGSNVKAELGSNPDTLYQFSESDIFRGVGAVNAPKVTIPHGKHLGARSPRHGKNTAKDSNSRAESRTQNSHETIIRDPKEAISCYMNSKLRLPFLKDVMIPKDSRSDVPAESKYVGSLGSGHDKSIITRTFKDNEGEVLEEALKLTSGEDAITFFARHGNSTPLKFVYCNRVSLGDIFQPYTLTVVPRKDVNPEHFTISASGVVHVRPGEPSEFISLADWMHQSTSFNILRSIPHFKHYLSAKMFRTWRSNVRHSIYCEKRKKLAKNLFLARRSFCEPLVQAKKLVHEMTQLKLLNVQSQVYHTESFVSDQVEQRTQSSKKFEESVEKMESLVEKVCREVKDRARFYSKALADDNSSFANHNAKSKSMVSIKKEKAERQRRLRHAQAEVDLLGSFVRVVDYMEVESLVEITQNSADEFLSVLQTRRQPLFKTSIAFDRDAIVFTPPSSELKQAVASMLVDIVASLTAVDRVLYMGNFKQFIFGSLADGPQVDRIVYESRLFRETKQGIEKKIEEDYKAASSTINSLDKFRPLYEYGETFVPEDYCNEDHTLSTLQRDMQKQREWAEDVDRNIRHTYDAGMLQVESRELKDSLLPITERALATMKDLLLKIFHEKSFSLLGVYQKNIRELDEDPQNIKNYAGHVEKFRLIRGDGESMNAQAKEVEIMHTLLTQHGIRIPPNDAVLLDDLRTAVKEFSDQINKTEQRIDDKMESMRQTVYKTISRISSELDTQKDSLNIGVFMDASKEPADVLKELDMVNAKISDLEQQCKTLQGYQVLFEMEPYPFPSLDETKAAFQKKKEFWDTYNRFLLQSFSWDHDNIADIDAEAVNRDVMEYFKTAHKMNKDSGEAAVTARFKDLIMEWKVVMPSILELGNKAMKESHWRKLFSELSQPFYPNQDISLSKLRTINIFGHPQLVSGICEQAVGEHSLMESLDKIREGWEEQSFIISGYQNTDDVFILGDLEDVFALLEENQANLQTMLASRFIVPVQQEVESWDSKLAFLAELLDEWLTCQRNWMYLEPIFTAEDIQRQLPAEAKQFTDVDKFWKETMRKVEKRPLALKVINITSILPNFIKANEQLEKIQKQLEEYLETKRATFPRFYFLSNDELLQILSQSRDPHAVQPHLRKIFDNIASLRFTDKENSTEVIGMTSGEGEYVPFPDIVLTEGATEHWLLAIENMMRVATHHAIQRGLDSYPEDGIHRDEWLKSHCSQAVCAVDQIIWTDTAGKALRKVESGEDKDAMKTFLEFSKEQISAMVEMVRGDLSKLDRRLMSGLIILDVHARDVVSEMIDQGCSSLNDYQWTKQLRYYWEQTSGADTENAKWDCVLRQTNTQFTYGYEYLGSANRLVITPLTDKAYLTLTGALHLHYGGAPAGPAGTGKTETVKDLAKSLAIQIVVFNCSDGLDSKMMGRFFSGLSQAGAWACFDEFNRIDIEVLSVIAQQILTIQQAISADKDIFDFEGRNIPLNKNFGVFITMNPGYAGRTELPDNLKALFRPVAMMIPDYALIAQIILFSEGFQTATTLSKKMVQLYKLSSEQLSKQDHYDFGMRAVKSVLVMAGALKRKDASVPEDVVLIRAMRDSNVPKFLSHDLPLFRGIITDLFPGVEVPFEDTGKLQTAIQMQLQEKNLQRVPAFVQKAIQLHETMIVRHGVMLVGGTGTGKSTCANILASALTQLSEDGVAGPGFKSVEQYTLNPKSITMGELYGQMNLISQEWSDGLVAKLIREAVAADSPNRKWITFDGPVDALWIENMNTVLDDNKVLCLANGERIKLPPSITMLFEVEDLSVASPATVSRCGMVYLEDVYLGWEPLVNSWKKKFAARLPSEQGERVVSAVLKYTPALLKFIREECKEMIASVDTNLVQSCLNLLDAFMVPENGISVADAPSSDLINKYALMSFVWSFGANLTEDSRDKFSSFIRKELTNLSASLPSVDAGSVFDFNVDPASGRFVTWQEQVKHFQYNPTTPFFNILVPTADTVKYSTLLETLSRTGKNVLLMGETGVGKTTVVKDFFQSSKAEEDFVYIPVMFSAQTSSKNLQDVLETKLEKKRKNLLGAPIGKKVVIFVDDLNMPQCEVYGAQPPVELLRQCIDQGGFYDRKKLFFKAIQDVQFVSACAPPGGGRNKVTPRLLRQFHMIWQPQLSEKSLKTIFSSILSGFLSHTVPGTPMSAAASPLIDASVELYQSISEELLPTPSKSHYTFNLRDLSKVVQGILQVTKENVPDLSSLVRLYTHESARVFRDRLINEEDRTWFDNKLASTIEKYVPDSGIDWKTNSVDNILFGSFMSQDDNVYAEVQDMTKVDATLRDYLEEYNLTFSNQMHLVFFKDAISHLSRVSRIIRQPRGNALLVGVGGSGRQSLTRMAAFMSGYTCMSIEITRGYGIAEWKESLRKLLFTAGAENQQVVFLFSDAQVVHESFLEDINNILNSGEVPNLFDGEQIEAIVNKVRPLARAAGKVETRDNIFNHFVQLVRENLHVVLAFSPIGDAFRARCRQYPSLVNCCTIDWYNEWPEEALYSVANRFLSQEEGLNVEEYTDRLCKMCVKIHTSVSSDTKKYYEELQRHNYVTPTSYLELIKLFVSMLGTQRDLVSEKLHRYSTGLTKLQETKSEVALLKESLIKLQPELKKSVEETAELLIVLEKDQREAQEKKVLVESDAKECEKTTAEVKIIKDDCQKDLDEALPAYESAIKALDTLKKEHITVIKSFVNPPQAVQTVMEAVCLLFGKKPTWEESKKLLGNTKFLDLCKTYDKDNIPTKTIKKLQKYVKDPDFLPEKMESVSAAAVSLCMWARAMDVYARVAKDVEPKRNALAHAEESLRAAQSQLATKQAELAEVEARVAALQAKYRSKLAERDELMHKEELTKARLERAEKLVNGLGSEETRWSETSKNLSAKLHNLVGTIILSAGCVSYLGPFTAEYRQQLADEWVKYSKQLELPVDDSFSLVQTLADPIVMREWSIAGLPADNYSVENGLFVTKGRRWPLMIDPQAQANRWIKAMEGQNNLQVIKLSDPNYLRTLENAIRYGQPVLLENVEETLDAAIEPVLLKQVFKKGGQWLLRLGDQDIPYSADFRLYITTKLANPHYLPEIFVKVTVINFTVTPKGLEDQLLVDVCRLERPDLEEKNDGLIVQISNDQKELSDIEVQILQMLAESQGNILDDEDLINALDASKTTSLAVKARVAEAEETVAEITTVREKYRVVARRGSVLYFAVADLANVDPMYQYSLHYFANLYRKRIECSEKSDHLPTRLETLQKDIVRSIYVNICRGLFEKDKLLFSFLMASSIAKSNGRIQSAEWNVLIRGTAGIKIDKTIQGPRWIKEKEWFALLALEHIADFPAIATGAQDSVTSSPEPWQKFLQADNPSSAPLPEAWADKITPFQKLLIVNAVRSEKLVDAVRMFVGAELGAFFVESPPFDLQGVYEDSSSTVPIIFVLSPGADPMSYLLRLAKEKGMEEERFRYISLGQGQGPIAEQLMEQGRRNGDWICLQNCHLAASWLPQLERILELATASPEKIHPDFRLWLTSMPTKAFPVPILQNSIKLTNEPPKGVRANVLRTFQDLSEEEYNSCSKALPFKKLLYGLAFFHAVIQERRKFGAIGWNIPYAWMNSDFEVSKAQLRMYLDDNDDVPWETLREIIGEVNYAGRVTDDKDQRCVRSLLSSYINEEALKDAYKLVEGVNAYSIPAEGALVDAKAHIASLPPSDAPAIFGLHQNADVTFQLKESGEMLQTLVSIQPRASGSEGGKSPDEQVDELAAELLERLPALLNRKDAHESTFAHVDDGQNTLGVFFGQELDRFNKLLSVIRSTLKDLRRGIKGLVVMSSDLERMFRAFLFDQVPPSWEAVAYPSLKPLTSWFHDLVLRVEFMRSWLTSGAPSSYWLPGFFFPQGFMTAALQRHARQTKIPIDTLQFRTEVLKITPEQLRAGPKTGVYIHGLFLQGAGWDMENACLVESDSGELFKSMPVIWLDPVTSTEVSEKSTYDCPVYKTSRRAGELSTTGHSTNFVLYLQLASSESSSHWIRRGVALLTQLDS